MTHASHTHKRLRFHADHIYTSLSSGHEKWERKLKRYFSGVTFQKREESMQAGAIALGNYVCVISCLLVGKIYHHRPQQQKKNETTKQRVLTWVISLTSEFVFGCTNIFDHPI